jgi:DNA-binding CsgD family transcriptional regulator/5-methylcytosine-specific restriction endonuclease McrA
VFVSPTRAQIAALLAQGLSMAEVARRTGLAYTTVSYHRSRLLQGQAEPGRTSSEEPPPESFHAPITTREEVHRLLRAGHSRANVARRLGLSKSTVTYHAWRFGMDIDERAARRYDWRVIQQYYDAGHSMEQCRARFGFCKASWSSAVRRGEVLSRASAMPIEELLAAPRGRANLKRRLIKAGLLTQCCRQCGIRTWRGLPLALQLHHINGDRHDNRLGNLALLCPNCHSQTDTWAGRNAGRDPTLGLRADSQPLGAERQEAA